MRARHGSALLMCLLLVVTLVVLGMGFLGQHSAGRLAARRVSLSAQARELARTGLESARARRNCDLRFPPSGETRYVYSETVTLSDGTVVGSYEVVVDSSLLSPPYEVLQVQSLGFVGPRNQPIAYHQLSGELDLARRDRINSSVVNPRLGHWINFWDQGGP